MVVFEFMEDKVPELSHGRRSDPNVLHGPTWPIPALTHTIFIRRLNASLESSETHSSFIQDTKPAVNMYLVEIIDLLLTV
jgi:hypothetical protein